MPSLEVTREELLAGLGTVGIEAGDVVYVASSLAPLGLMDDPVGSTLWALREAVGPEGTLVMPTFNFGFCQGERFDREETPSRSGVLTEAFRRSPGTMRTWAPPFHTLAAAGPRAAEIGAIQALTSFGRDSAFQYLCDVDAKHLLIGCGYHQGVAHFHWMEELYEVPYRYWKKFEGEVRTSGETRRRAFFMYARRLEPDARVDAEPLGQEFERAGYVRQTTVGICRLRAFDLGDFKAFVGGRLADDPLAMLVPEQRAAYSPRRSPVKRVDHIAVVSRYSTKIREFVRSLACELAFEGIVPELGVNCQYFGGLEVAVEFVDPVPEGSRVDGHLRQHPTAPLHHIAFEVADLAEALEFFREKGYAPLDGQFHLGPRPYQRVVFLSPVQTGGLLVELVANDGRGDEAYGGGTRS